MTGFIRADRKRLLDGSGRPWGLFVINAKPVNLLTATFEEIAEAYRAGRTERARKTYICEVMEERFRER